MAFSMDEDEEEKPPSFEEDESPAFETATFDCTAKGYDKGVKEVLEKVLEKHSVTLRHHFDRRKENFGLQVMFDPSVIDKSGPKTEVRIENASYSVAHEICEILECLVEEHKILAGFHDDKKTSGPHMIFLTYWNPTPPVTKTLRLKGREEAEWVT